LSILGMIGRLFARAKSGDSSTSTSRIVHSRRQPSGVYVDPDTALQNATVWACVQYLTKAVAQLPWRVMRDSANGGADVAASHPVDWLLHHRPCPDLGSFSWRQAMLGTALTWGNAYAEIEWDNRGVAYALWPIHPSRVNVRRGEDGRLEYEVWNRGGNVVLPAADVFHVRGFGDGAVGFNVIEYAAQSIGWARATEIFGAAFFGEGINPSLIVESPNALSPEARSFLLAELKKLYGGPRGEKTMVLDAGIKANKLTMAPDEAQFVETRQHQVEEICRWFGVPPHKVMHLLRATFSNIEHQSIEVVVDSVTPWVKVFEEEANYKLFGQANRAGFYTKMNLRGLLRGDATSRAQLYSAMFGMGMTINQILALEDMNGIGPDGDVPFVSNNVQTLERAIRGEPTAPAERPAPSDDEVLERIVNLIREGGPNGRRLSN
jgi:HK97 family phage portal protein